MIVRIGKGFTGVVGKEHVKSAEWKKGKLMLIETYLKAVNNGV